jgi:hypothetical protein
LVLNARLNSQPALSPLDRISYKGTVDHNCSRM